MDITETPVDTPNLTPAYIGLGVMVAIFAVVLIILIACLVALICRNREKNTKPSEDTRTFQNYESASISRSFNLYLQERDGGTGSLRVGNFSQEEGTLQRHESEEDMSVVDIPEDNAMSPTRQESKRYAKKHNPDDRPTATAERTSSRRFLKKGERKTGDEDEEEDDDSFSEITEGTENFSTTVSDNVEHFNY